MDRARVHARELNRLVTEALRDSSHRFDHEDAGNVRRYFVEGVPPVDPDWALILGDFLTNVRAALDHLAWQLPLLEGSAPPERTSFPIREKAKTDGNGNAKPPAIGGVTRGDVVAQLERVQPDYVRDKYGHPKDEQGLYVLNKLVNRDKHSVLVMQSHFLNPHGIWWGLDSEEGSPTYAFDFSPLDGSRRLVATFDFGDHPIPSGFEPNLSLDIFLTGENLSLSLVRTCNLLNLMQVLYYAVEWEVVGDGFAPFFGTENRYLNSISD